MCCYPISSAVGKLRQEDYKFKASLTVYQNLVPELKNNTPSNDEGMGLKKEMGEDINMKC